MTIWTGTFFDCPGNEIRLRHSQYPIKKDCNSRDIVAKIVGVLDNCYTSQLIITIREEMINKTIKCIHDNNEESGIIIGQKSLMATDTIYPPPTNIHVDSSDSSQITFAWDEVTAQCSSLRYIITAINCGLCPNTTADKNVTCNIQTDISQRTNDTCMFAVQTEICGYLHGKRSDYVTIHINGE